MTDIPLFSEPTPAADLQNVLNILINEINGQVRTLTASEGSVFSSRLIASLTEIPSMVFALQTAGYASRSDGGGAVYYRASGTTPGGFQSYDGAWWALAPGETFNVRQFGATGGGALDDAAAIQTTIDAAAVGGGTVAIPPGTYKCLSTLTLPSCSLGTGVSVNIVGAGPQNTFLSWPTDLGLGEYAIICEDRAVSSMASDGLCSGFSMVGPAGVSPPLTMGTFPANMRGFGRAARRRMSSVYIYGFYAGLCHLGDHSLIENVQAVHCGYGIYNDVSNPTLFGDNVFIKCLFGSCSVAAHGVGPNTAIGEDTFVGCYLSAAPFGLFKETGGSTSAVAVSTVYTNCLFEAIGNAMIADDATASTRASALTEVAFEGVFFSWDLAHWNWAAKNQDAIISIQNMVRCTISVTHQAQNWTPGTTSLFNFTFAATGIISGNWTQLLTNCVNASLPVFSGTSSSVQDLAIVQPGLWSGFPSVTHTADPAVGSIAVADASSVVQSVEYSAGTAAECPVGVFMSTCAVNKFAVVATKGKVAVITNGTPSGSGVPLRTDAAGKAVEGTGRNDATSSFLGVTGTSVATLIMTGF